MDQKLKAVWDGMNNAVTVKDKTGALSYLSVNAQEKYGPVFDALQASYQSIISTWSAPVRGNISNTFGEYAVTTTNDGATQLFLIYFLQGADGVWRLDAM